LEDVRKSTVSTLKTWRKPAWNEDGDSLQDSTLAYSGMPGGLSKEDYELLQAKKITEEQANKIRKQL
jgi:hypothetical protein